MSTRACYRFVEPGTKEVTTVYKHHDGYPSGAVEAIGKALEFAWPLPRFEADEFAAAFCAGNKTCARLYRQEYLDRAAAETDPKLKTDLLDMANSYLPDGRYAGIGLGGGVRIVNQPGLDACFQYASDIEYVYDITVSDGALLVTAHEVTGDAKTKKIFRGSLDAMKKKYCTD